MDLFIVRHADAGDPAEWPGADSERPLNVLGHRQARALGQALHRHGITLGAVVSSPFVRARETAEDLLAAWGDGFAPSFSDLLASGMMRKRKLSQFLAGLGLSSLAIVGHDPDLPEYIGWLVGTEPDHVRLAKGGAAYLRIDKELSKGEGRIIWFITPEWYLPAESEAPKAV